MDRPTLADFVLAPLRWLERARGRRRRVLLLGYIVIALILGVFGWRELSLWRLPKAPEPFDIEKYGRVDLADSDNAMLLYRVAGGMVENYQAGNVYRPAGLKPWEETDWSRADPEVIRWAVDNRLALEPWLLAVEKPAALVCQPEELTINTLMKTVQAIRQVSTLAALEGSRLEQAGDLAGAWRMYRGLLRSSRHAEQHGVLIQRLVGSNVLKRANTRVTAWTDNPAVTSALLRRAITDVEACREMTPPASETVRAEYFVSRDAFRHPERWAQYEIDEGLDPYAWYNRIEAVRLARRFLRRDPERSLHVLRLVVAGHLAQADRPIAARPKVRFPQFMIYDHDLRTPPAVRAITPEALESWARDSALNNFTSSFHIAQPLMDAEIGILDAIRIRMAERAFRLDHGRPARTYAELLGPYLATLPEGIEPTDPIGGSPVISDQ